MCGSKQLSIATQLLLARWPKCFFLLACITKKMLFVSITLAFVGAYAVNLTGSGWLFVRARRNCANQSGFILVSCIYICVSIKVYFYCHAISSRTFLGPNDLFFVTMCNKNFV